MDFFEHQHKAKQKTKLLVFYFVLAVVLIISVINTVVFQLGNNSGQFHLSFKQWLVSPYFVIISLSTIMVIILGSLIRGLQVRGGGQAVAKMVKARSISMNSKDKLERRFIHVVEEMSIASGMPVPSLYVMDNEMGMNAFVAGLVPSDTVMVVTQGLLEKLNRQELQGVVAHEFSHILNADMRINMRLIAILGGILALGQLGYFLMRSMRYSRHRRSSSGSNNNQLTIVIFGAAASLLVVGYIGLFFGRLIKAAISRQREFLADASAVQYSRDSMGIANALYKIKTNGKGSLLDSSHAEDMSHMCFGSALKFTAFSSLLATHPPIDDRIKTLVPGYQATKSSSAHSNHNDEDSVFSGISQQETVNRNTKFNDVVAVTSAEQLVDQIGQLHPSQLNKAKSIYEELPELLIDAAHEPNTAYLLVLSIIVSGSKGDIDTLISSIIDRLDVQQIAKVKEFSSLVNSVNEHLIFPLIELTIPVLKKLNNENKKNLLASASVLIKADTKIVPFEFFLYALLRKNLSEKDAAFNNQNFKKYKPVLGDIQYLLSILSESNDGDRLEYVTMAMKSFDHKWQLPTQLPNYNASQLHKSLHRLNLLTPLLKKPLMQTFAELVMQDGKILKEEIELLRAVCLYLECPIPPLS